MVLYQCITSPHFNNRTVVLTENILALKRYTLKNLGTKRQDIPNLLSNDSGRMQIDVQIEIRIQMEVAMQILTSCISFQELLAPCNCFTKSLRQISLFLFAIGSASLENPD